MTFMRFTYKALKNNKIKISSIEAEDVQTVVGYLRNQGYFTIEVKEQKNNADLSFLSGKFDKVSFTDIVDFTRQISIMLNAGLTLVDSLEILKKQLTKESLRKMIVDLDNEIKGGNSFSSALKKYPNLFPNLYISLIKSGEASGKLGDITLKLADNLEKQREFQGKMKGALIYPVIVVTGMLVVMFIMVTFVVPRLLGLYKDFNIELPVTTQILIGISSFTSKYWPVILGGVFGFIALLKRYTASKLGKLNVDTMMLKIPYISNVIKMSALVDSTRTLSILTASGVSILDALDIIIDTTENAVYQHSFAEIKKKVEKGDSLGSALEQEGIFPPIFVQMTLVGEKTGHLDETLFRLSKYFESESELATKAMTTLIEPLILVFLGLGVGFLVLSVITPIYNLTSSFK